MTADSIFEDKQTIKNDINEKHNDKLQIRYIPLTTFYRPQADSYRLSEVGFIVIEDGWDENNKSVAHCLHYKPQISVLIGSRL